MFVCVCPKLTFNVRSGKISVINFDLLKSADNLYKVVSAMTTVS